MLLFMNHSNDFVPCGPSIGQYNSYSYSLYVQTLLSFTYCDFICDFLRVNSVTTCNE